MAAVPLSSTEIMLLDELLLSTLLTELLVVELLTELLMTELLIELLMSELLAELLVIELLAELLMTELLSELVLVLELELLIELLAIELVMELLLSELITGLLIELATLLTELTCFLLLPLPHPVIIKKLIRPAMTTECLHINLPYSSNDVYGVKTQIKASPVLICCKGCHP